MQTWNTIAITRILFLLGRKDSGRGQRQTNYLKLENRRN